MPTTRLRVGAPLLLLGLAACAPSATGGSGDVQRPSKRALPLRPTEPSAAPVTEAPALPLAEAGAPAELPPEVRLEAHYPGDATVATVDWLAAHQATATLVEKECWDLGDRVGVPAAPGLLCVRSTSRPSRTQARIYRLEDGRLRAVWEGPVATYANWLELTPLLSADGASLMVHERRSFDCEAAMEEYNAKEGAGVPMDWGGVLREGCALRGKYVYDGKRYVKQKEASGAPAP